MPDRATGRPASRGSRVRASLLVALAACACGLAGAMAHAAERNVIRIVDPDGRLAEHEASIREILAATLARVETALPINGVTITVTPDPARSIGGWGIGGFTPDARTVSLYIDPGFPDLGRLLAERVPPMLAHEMHHARRWSGPGYGRSLFEAMVSEGLADRFAIELLGTPVPPWCDAFPREETASRVDAARPELDSAKYDHTRWFFGAKPPPARWTGYTIGYRIVEAWQSTRPDDTAAKLVDTRARAFKSSLARLASR